MIDQHIIGSKRTFIIAEIGNNHNGEFDLAVELIDRAKRAGANAVKFQMRHLEEVYRRRSLDKKGDDLGTEYVIDLLSRFQLSIDEHKRLSDYCSQIGILYLCTAWDKKSVEVLEGMKVPAFKVASADLTNQPLLYRLIETKKPLIVSTGMSSEAELRLTVDFLNSHDAQFVLLHCNSTYPAPVCDINLKWMHKLKSIHPLIGYSGHERGIYVSLAAVALGATVIERHFTLDRDMEGPDHAASLIEEEFTKLVHGIREIEVALGNGEHRELSQGEMINRENLGKSLVAACLIQKGTVIKKKHIKVRSPGLGLSPQNRDKLLGQVIKRDMNEEDFFYESDLMDARVLPTNYNFSRPWGIPVRYHDFSTFNSMIKPEIWEFHLSYSDMELNPGDYFAGQYECDLVVHAPELFAGGKLMDLASPDLEYRRNSLRETQRVIDITRDLKTYFPKSDRPKIVANIGGHTMDEPLPEAEILGYYERFAASLQTLDLDGVELLPQTMAPFPWHFGGQRYQNLFVKIDEIVNWCQILDIRMCFDVSHSFLACNYLQDNFFEFSKKIAPYTAHLHLGDAKGTNGEGLQIGNGEIDFIRLAKILAEGCPSASFIPEIWQGHKNNGEGFWLALKRLNAQI